MTKSNGRKAQEADKRKSPYNGSGTGSHLETPPEIAGLPRGKIGQCLRTVKIALLRANRSEAIAAVMRAFKTEERRPISGRSFLEELADRCEHPREGFLAALNKHNIFTIGDLILLDLPSLGHLADKNGIRQSEVDNLALCVENLGFRFALIGEDD